jgi:hypothetical protein
MKLPVIGGMTQAEGVALGAFVTSGDQCRPVPDLNLGIHGVLLGNGASSFVHPTHSRAQKRKIGFSFCFQFSTFRQTLLCGDTLHCVDPSLFAMHTVTSTDLNFEF